jgi:hypothetical protein
MKVALCKVGRSAQVVLQAGLKIAMRSKYVMSKAQEVNIVSKADGNGFVVAVHDTA